MDVSLFKIAPAVALFTVLASAAQAAPPAIKPYLAAALADPARGDVKSIGQEQCVRLKPSDIFL